MQGSFEITREIDIDASPEMVFRFFTEPALLERWLCVQAEVDAHPGGSYVFNVTGSHITRGTLPGRGAGPPAGLHVAVRSRRAAAAEPRWR